VYYNVYLTLQNKNIINIGISSNKKMNAELSARKHLSIIQLEVKTLVRHNI
jgi:hypothetical protein